MKFDRNNKLVLKILSTLVALVLWFAITYTEDPVISQYLSDISIVYDGEKDLVDNGLIIINKNEIPGLSAVIRGKRSNVIAAMGTVVASCDVSGIETVGENNVQLKYVYPTSTITMAKIKTKEVTLKTEKIISRSIPLKITIKNAEKNAEYIVNPRCDIDKIRIKGAETDVYNAAYANVVVDVAEMEKNNTQEYLYEICDKSGSVISEENIISKSNRTINIDNSVYQKATLPVKVKLGKRLSEDYYLNTKTITPDKIDVGIIDDIGVTELVAELDEVTEGSEYNLKITVPDGVYLPEDKEEIKVICDVIPLKTEEKEVKVEIINKQDTKLAITPETINVKIRYPKGYESEVKLKATVDLTDINENEEAPVKIEASEKVRVIGEYSVKVYIK